MQVLFCEFCQIFKNTYTYKYIQISDQQMEGSEIKNAQKQPHRSSLPEAINKTMSTGTGNKMRRTRGIGEMLRNIPGNVAKHSAFREMFSNIPGNIVKDSAKCPQQAGFQIQWQGA